MTAVVRSPELLPDASGRVMMGVVARIEEWPPWRQQPPFAARLSEKTVQTYMRESQLFTLNRVVHAGSVRATGVQAIRLAAIHSGGCCDC